MNRYCPDLAAAQAAMAATDVNARWQAQMAEFFTGLDGRRPDEGFELLDEVFHLETQLARHTATQNSTQNSTQNTTQNSTQNSTEADR